MQFLCIFCIDIPCKYSHVLITEFMVEKFPNSAEPLCLRQGMSEVQKHSLPNIYIYFKYIPDLIISSKRHDTYCICEKDSLMKWYSSTTELRCRGLHNSDFCSANEKCFIGVNIIMQFHNPKCQSWLLSKLQLLVIRPKTVTQHGLLNSNSFSITTDLP